MTQEEITTIIGMDVFVKGDLTILSSIRIEGTLEGNLSSTGLVIVAAGGTVNGNVVARDTVVNGTINGSLTSTVSAMLEQGSTMNGDLFTGKVTLAEGSKFNGKCTMIKRRDLIVDQSTKEVRLIELSPEQILTQS